MESDNPARKLKLLRFSADVLLRMMKGQCKVEAGLPSDAKPIRTQYSFEKDAIEVMVESDEFPEIKEGEFISSLDVVLRSTPYAPEP